MRESVKEKGRGENAAEPADVEEQQVPPPPLHFLALARMGDSF
jgi:hypothetical protein